MTAKKAAKNIYLKNDFTTIINLPKKASNFIFKNFYLIITFLCYISPNVKACPIEVKAMCQCVDRLEGVELNCTRVDVIGLLNVLRVSQSQLGLLKSLSIRQSKIPVLPNKLFAGLFIKKLDLIESKIQIIENQAFNGLEQVLQELTIVNNEITNVPVQALNGFSGLLKLDFSNNLIQELKLEDAIPRLPKVIKHIL